jgi:hypothetical protein
MALVPPPPGRPAADRAGAVLERLLYLPLHPALAGDALRRMARAIEAFEREHAGAHAPTRHS